MSKRDLLLALGARAEGKALRLRKAGADAISSQKVEEIETRLQVAETFHLLPWPLSIGTLGWPGSTQ